MKEFFALFLLVFFVISGGCNKPLKEYLGGEITENKPLTVIESKIPMARTLPDVFKQEIVSDLAAIHYIDFETSSWEREYMPEFIMIHFMNGVVISKEDPYNKDIVRSIFMEPGVGINYVIDREGNILCMLPENRCAWHAGEGEFLNTPKYTNKINFYSIGIELMAIGSKADMAQYIDGETYDSLDDSLKGFTDEQYESLNLLLTELCERYEIPRTKDRIIGHEEFSPHKSDPGELFDWSRLELDGRE